MPQLMSLFSYKIYFWSNEGYPTEPLHVHISKYPHSNATKVWITKEGICILENNNDQIPGKDLKRILNAINDFSDEIIKAWTKHFGVPSYIDEKEETIEM